MNLPAMSRREFVRLGAGAVVAANVTLLEPLAQAAEYGFILGRDIANQDKLPDWRTGDQFHR